MRLERLNPGKVFIPNQTASFTLSKALHNGKFVCTGNLTGTLTIFLPPAVGDLCEFTVLNFGNISGGIVFKTRSPDVFRGLVKWSLQPGPVNTFGATGVNNTLTFDGATIGNWIQGEFYKFQDCGFNVAGPPQGHWLVDTTVGAAGTPANPFSTV